MYKQNLYGNAFPAHKEKSKKMAVDLLFHPQEIEDENVTRGKVTAWLLFAIVIIGMLVMFVTDVGASASPVMRVSVDSLVDDRGEE